MIPKPVRFNIKKKNAIIAFLLLAIVILFILNNSKKLHKKLHRLISRRKKTAQPTKVKIKFEDEFKKIQRRFYSHYCDPYSPHAQDKLEIQYMVPSKVELFDLYMNEEAMYNYTVENNLENTTTAVYLNNLVQVRHGGHWAPTFCRARHRIAIIIPYRDRADNLKTWLYNMHPFLQRQELNYTIFVVEQTNSGIFNKGILMNAAFNEILVKNNFNNQFDCVIYHDVDMLPTDELNYYTCPTKRPRHLSILVDEIDYRKIYPILVGGVMIYRKEHFIEVNGYSNKYWGWGAEDDDMYYRLELSGVYFDRPAYNTKYSMLKHLTRWANPKRYEILMTNKNQYKNDGLTTAKYTNLGSVKYSLFTHLLVDVGVPTNISYLG